MRGGASAGTRPGAHGPALLRLQLMDGQMDRQADKRTGRQTDGRIGRWTGRQMEQWMDRQMDGQTDG